MKKIIIGIVLSLSVALLSFIAVSCGEEYKALPAPQNFRQYANENSYMRKIIWDEVLNAWGYVVKFDGEEYDTEKTEFDLPKKIQPGIYEIEVYAYGDIKQNNDSATVKYKFRIAESIVHEQNGFDYYLLEDGESYEVRLSAKAEYVSTLEIPSSFNGLPVKAASMIKNPFSGASTTNRVTTKIIIPSTIERFETIQGYAAIEEIEIPDTVKVLGAGTFKNCHKLKHVKLPRDLKEIPKECFSCCDLYELEIPNGVERIGEEAFYAFGYRYDYLSNLKKITIPDSVKEIEQFAFFGCKLEEIIFSPQSQLEVIDNSAFGECKSLTKITFPPNLKELKAVFSNCTSLTEVTLPSSLEILDGVIFRDTLISEVVIPHSLKKMGLRPFPECMQKIYYEGTQAEWEALSAQYNGDLEKPFYDAKIYYYSDASADNCWHYVDGIPTPWNEE